MKLSCDLYVDGLFEGMIRSNKLVTVGKNGKVKGDVHASKLVVQGLVDGIIEAELVEIKSTGRVHGSVTSAELAIEAKGVFEGDSKIKNAEKLSVPKKTEVKAKTVAS
jgi:cytoskeletal protein CcmA (bactofilin family)